MWNAITQPCCLLVLAAHMVLGVQAPQHKVGVDAPGRSLRFTRRSMATTERMLSFI